MKSLEQTQVEQLMQILQSKPGQRIVQFADTDNILINNVHHLCQTNDTKYYLYCTQVPFFDSIKSNYADASHIQVVNFNLRRPRYLMQAIEFDYLISTLDFENENKTEFLEKCYPIVRTGGNIILIIPNASYAERDEWQEVLEEQYYVSVNIMDDMFEDYDVIVAKRMHGWGN